MEQALKCIDVMRNMFYRVMSWLRPYEQTRKSTLERDYVMRKHSMSKKRNKTNNAASRKSSETKTSDTIDRTKRGKVEHTRTQSVTRVTKTVTRAKHSKPTSFSTLRQLSHKTGTRVAGRNSSKSLWRVADSNTPILDDACRPLVLPSARMSISYCGRDSIELISRCYPGERWTFRKRDEKERSQMRPLVYPARSYKQQWARTHLLPFGYHGSENDQRLVIGWSLHLNATEMADFENTASRLGIPIIWVCKVVRHKKKGATLRYHVYDTHGKQIMSKAWTMDCAFNWRA